jgi:hypothetical protein
MGLIVTASDIEAEQSRVLASANATDAAVQACTTIDAPTKSEWSLFVTGLKDFCSRPVCNFWYPWMPSNCLMATANTGDTMLAWEANLTAWQVRVAKLCTGAPPGLQQFNPNPATETATQWLRYFAIIAGAVGTAYVVSEAVPFVRSVLPARGIEPKRLKP